MKTLLLLAFLLVTLTTPDTAECSGCAGPCTASSQCGAEWCVCATDASGYGQCVQGRR